MAGNRRQFLGNVAALSAGGLFLPSALGAETPGPEPVSADWDVTWRDRVKSEFRAVFDNPILNEGGGVWLAIDWIRRVREAYGDQEEGPRTVLVVRHEAVPVIRDRACWEPHGIGAEHKLNARSGNPVKYTPYLAREGAAGEDGGRRGGGTIDSFIASGGIVLACNYAFGRSVVGKEARKAGIDQAAARTAVLAQVIPGVIIQPSGFFAVIEAQRVGCHFFPAAG